MIDLRSELPLSTRRAFAEHAWHHLVERFDPRQLQRVRGMLDIFSGAREPILQPHQHCPDGWHMPGLETPGPWLDTERFSFMKQLEAAASSLRREYQTLVAEGVDFVPYGSPPGAKSSDPVPFGRLREWRELNVVLDFKRDESTRSIAPIANEFADALGDGLERISQLGYLVLYPGAKLLRHTDPFGNIAVACHLGLIIPEGCWLEVAGERRVWTENRCIAFDNSYAHTAANFGSSPRAILIVYGLNPYLTEVEQLAILAIRKFAGSDDLTIQPPQAQTDVKLDSRRNLIRFFFP
jgi:aspartyl/asparaginyl beta-hydroxylase